jgi:hypothetical protein
MIDLYTKFHVPNSSGLLVIVIKLEAKEIFCTVTMLL